MPGKSKHPFSVRRMQFDDVEELDDGANRNRGKDGGSSPAVGRGWIPEPFDPRYKLTPKGEAATAASLMK